MPQIIILKESIPWWNWFLKGVKWETTVRSAQELKQKAEDTKLRKCKIATAGMEPRPLS